MILSYRELLKISRETSKSTADGHIHAYSREIGREIGRGGTDARPDRHTCMGPSRFLNSAFQPIDDSRAHERSGLHAQEQLDLHGWKNPEIVGIFSNDKFRTVDWAQNRQNDRYLATSPPPHPPKVPSPVTLLTKGI